MQDDRITKARMALILDAPFFGHLIMRLRMVADPSQPTLYTDAVRIGYNPEFVSGLSDSELVGVLAHEVAHVALGHLWRLGDRQPVRWNHACDYAVNELLVEYADSVTAKGRSAPWSLPACALRETAFRALSSEEIYEQIPPGTTCPVSLGVFGPPVAGEETPPSPEELQREWTLATIQAAQAAVAHGHCPAGIQRLLETLTDPKVPWRDLLREFLRRPAKDDYAWTHPNPRFAASGFLLPSLRSHRIGRLAVAIDTSGSIDAATLSAFEAEVQATLDECRPAEIEVLVCDAALQRVQRFQPGDRVQIDAVGGGGTDFRPVFAHLAGEGEDPECLIFFTDLYGTFPEEEPGYPVLWAAYGTKLDPPWGEVVRVEA